MRLRLSLLAPVAAVLALGACADQSLLTAPRSASTPASVVIPTRSGDRLATIGWEGSTPTLYIQDADGANRVRVHFDHVSDHVTGNYSPRQLPVTDESIKYFTRARWSPDGRYLAVIVAPAYDALQIVLVTADGLALRTISPNSQYLWGDIDWSPDSRRIAYIMARGPSGLLPDIFMTDLGPDAVTEVTSGARMSGYDVLRFDADGTHILFTEHLGWAPDGINSLSRVASVNLASGVVSRGDAVVGDPQGLARDGSFALFMRTQTAAPYLRDLIRLADGDKEMVLATGNVGGAAITEGDQEAVLTDWGGRSPSFSAIGLGQPDDLRAKLSTADGTTWATLWRAP